MSIYFLLWIGFQIALVLWPLTLLVSVALVRLFLLGRKIRFLDTLRSFSALVPGDIVLMGKQTVGHDWHMQLTNVMTDELKNRFWTSAGLYKGGGMIWEAGPAAGVVEKSLEHYASEGYLIRAFRHRFVNPEDQFAAADDFCRASQGHPYGAAGMLYYQLSTLIPCGLNFIFRQQKVDEFFKVEKAYFPAELVIDALDCAGAPLTGYDAWRVKPADLIHNPFLEEIKNAESAEIDREEVPEAEADPEPESEVDSTSEDNALKP